MFKIFQFPPKRHNSVNIANNNIVNYQMFVIKHSKECHCTGHQNNSSNLRPDLLGNFGAP